MDVAWSGDRIAVGLESREVAPGVVTTWLSFVGRTAGHVVVPPGLRVGIGHDGSAYVASGEGFTVYDSAETLVECAVAGAFGMSYEPGATP